MIPTELSSGFDHGAIDKTVSRDVISGQLATAVALRERLDVRGGAILGDEVGSGKTFVSFALITDLLLRNPDRGVVIFVPTQLLVTKWERQLRDYFVASVGDSALGRGLADRVHPMGRELMRAKRDAIVITTHTVFSYKTSVGDQGACLLAALDTFPEGKGRHHRSVMKAFGLDGHDGDFWPRWAQSDALNQKTLQPLRPVLRRYADGERELGGDMVNAVHEIRRLVGRRALPDAALVIIDEAHNLKSASSSVYRSLMSVLNQRFDALLFLTATPFQLGRQELLTIVDFFRASTLAVANPERFEKDRQDLSDAMDQHVDALDRFGRTWRDLTDGQTTEFAQAFADEVAGVGDPVVSEVLASLRAASVARLALESAMRPFVVRSVRERDHHETGAIDATFVAEGSRIPLALVDRLLVEIMRGRRTFVSSALISACSSWPALNGAAIMNADREPSAARDTLRELGARGLLGDHPKVFSTVSSVLAAVHRGEKTLVFVEREQTGEQLKEEILKALEAEKADDLSSEEAQLSALQDRTRLGWPSLRENYLSTLYPAAFGRSSDAADVQGAWSDPNVRELWNRCDVEGKKHHYGIEKRFWEHVLVTAAAAVSVGWRSAAVPNVAESVARVLEPDYILNGLDLVSGTTNERLSVPATPVRETPREPNLRFAEAFVTFRSPWSSCADLLAQLAPDVRARLVDVAASAIATSHLRAEIAAIDAGGDPAVHFGQVDALLLDPEGLWPTRFRALAQQAADAVRTNDAGLAEARITAILEALEGHSADRRVVFVKGGTATDTRQKAVDGFNTPLYPEVLIATPVLAEGLDLHRFCRRVIHHDLPWNPAKLEQRTGRVDRVGSLTERLREARPDERVAIEVALPFVQGTYDEFIHERVLVRRREFRCLLGNRPEWADDGELGDDESGQPMPEEVVSRLQVNLSPHV